MKTAITITIAGQVFTITDDAHAQLDTYLTELRAYFAKDSSDEESKEIMEDIEQRVSEILSERLSDGRQAVDVEDIDHIVKEMGAVEEIAKEDGGEMGKKAGTQHEQSETSENEEEGWRPGKKLYRDSETQVIGGVCSGLAAYFDIDVTWIRLAMLLLLFVNGIGFIAYILLWIAMPEATTAAEKAAMRGKRANISNIEKTVKERLSKGLTPEERDRARTGLQRFYARLGEIFQGIGRVLLAMLKVVAGIVSFVLGLTGLLVLGLGTALFIQLLTGTPGGFWFGGDSAAITAIAGLTTAVVVSAYITVALLGVLFILFAAQLAGKGKKALGWVVTLVITLFVVSGFVTANLGLSMWPDIQESYTSTYEDNQVTREYTWDAQNFSGINASGAVDVYVHPKTESPSGEAMVLLTGSERMVDLYEAEIDTGQTAELEIRRGTGIQLCFLFCHDANVRADVYMDELADISLSGASTLTATAPLGELPDRSVRLSGASEATFESDQVVLDVQLSGASELTVAGTTNILRGKSISGASDLQAVDLQAKQVELKLSGASSAVVAAEELLTVKASGASEVQYIGEPTEDISTSGSSSVRRKQ